MAFTLFEYPNVVEGQPVEPPGKRTACTPGTPYTLAPSTRYAAVVSDADLYLRISVDGAAATTADHFLPAGESRGFLVGKGDTPKVNGTAA